MSLDFHPRLPSATSFKMKELQLLIISLFMLLRSAAQVDSLTSVNYNSEEASMEDFVRRTESVIDFSDISGVNTFFNGGKININEANEDELSSLQLNDIQIVNLTGYIVKYGALAGIYELNLVEGFDSSLIMRLEPYISFKMNREIHKISLKSLANNGRHSLLGRWSRSPGERKGYTNDVYAGSPDKFLVKYGYKFYNRLRLGITMEKDPGESFRHGFDYYSAHLFYQAKGIVRSVVAGDYYAGFGQGLTINNGFSLFNDLFPSLPTSSSNGIRPSTGANESGPFRGCAITLAPLGHTRLSVLWSYNQLDAGTEKTGGLNDSVNMGSNTVRSIYETGLHRTTGEILNKGRTGQTVYGSNINTSIGFLRLGATALYSRYSDSVNPRLDLYNQFRFRGKSMKSYGVDFRAVFKDITVSGELSQVENSGSAFITMFQYLPYSDFGFSLNYRNYSRNYSNAFSNAWSQSSTCSNEMGFSAGLFFKPSRYTTLSAWADHYSHPWLLYNVDSPSSGFEYLIKFRYQKPTGEECLLRYSYSRKQGDTAILERHSLRLHLSYHPFNTIFLKNRIEIALHQTNAQKATTGFLIYQDVIIKPAGKSYRMHLRYALFNTDSFDERIYAREDDVPLSYSIVPYYYCGSRFYITGMYALSRDIDIWLKYSHEFYPGRRVIGTGYEEMEGNTRSEVTLQLMMKL